MALRYINTTDFTFPAGTVPTPFQIANVPADNYGNPLAFMILAMRYGTGSGQIGFSTVISGLTQNTDWNIVEQLVFSNKDCDILSVFGRTDKHYAEQSSVSFYRSTIGGTIWDGGRTVTLGPAASVLATAPNAAYTTFATTGLRDIIDYPYVLLTGTLTTNTFNTSVVGTGTLFLSELVVGSVITTTNNSGTAIESTVLAIADDTHMTIDRIFTPALPNATFYRRDPFTTDLYGVGTLWASELAVGDQIIVTDTANPVTTGNDIRTVAAIISDTHIQVDTPWVSTNLSPLDRVQILIDCIGTCTFCLFDAEDAWTDSPDPGLSLNPVASYQYNPQPGRDDTSGTSTLTTNLTGSLFTWSAPFTSPQLVDPLAKYTLAFLAGWAQDAPPYAHDLTGTKSLWQELSYHENDRAFTGVSIWTKDPSVVPLAVASFDFSYTWLLGDPATETVVFDDILIADPRTFNYWQFVSRFNQTVNIIPGTTFTFRLYGKVHLADTYAQVSQLSVTPFAPGSSFSRVFDASNMFFGQPAPTYYRMTIQPSHSNTTATDIPITVSGSGYGGLDMGFDFHFPDSWNAVYARSDFNPSQVIGATFVTIDLAAHLVGGIVTPLFGRSRVLIIE